jgi:DNA polymerase-3 subunit epsilon
MALRQVMSTFTAIDVETANADRASICQIGIVTFVGGTIADEWQSLVNPEDEFDPMNVFVHGIRPDDVEGAPTWPQTWPMVTARLENAIVVSHTGFDRVSVMRAGERYGLPVPPTIWLDSARVARRAWPEQCAARGFGLRALAAHFSLTYVAHDALEDARTAGQILLRAVADTGVPVSDWLARVTHPLYCARGTSGIAAVGNPDGPLAGEVIVFTGSLAIVRKEAAAMAAAAGCGVQDNVTRHTTLLVVGDQDVRHLAGHEKSSKHRKAETLIQSGQYLKVISEQDFARLVAAEAGSVEGSEAVL